MKSIPNFLIVTMEAYRTGTLIFPGTSRQLPTRDVVRLTFKKLNEHINLAFLETFPQIKDL